MVGLGQRAQLIIEPAYGLLVPYSIYERNSQMETRLGSMGP